MFLLGCPGFYVATDHLPFYSYPGGKVSGLDKKSSKYAPGPLHFGLDIYVFCNLEFKDYIHTCNILGLMLEGLWRMQKYRATRSY